MKHPRQRIWIFFLIYFFFWMASNSLEPYLGLFYEARGLSGTQIGFATTVFSLAAVLSSLAGGFLGDRIGRPSLIIPALAGGMIATTAVLYFSHGAVAILCAVFCYGFCYSPVNGIADKALLDELQDRKDRFSRLRMGGTLGAGTGVVLAAFFVHDSSFLTAFSVFWFVIMLCGICARYMPEAHQTPPDTLRWADYGKLVASPYFLPVYLPLVIWGFTESGVMQFLALYITRTGYPAEMTSLLIAVAMVGELLGFYVMPRLSRRLSHRHILAAAFLLQAIRMFSLAALRLLPVPLVVLCQFVGGGAYALLYSTITTVISMVYPSSISYSAHSLKLIANRGIGVSTGMLLLGALFDRNLSVAGYAILALTAAAGVCYFLRPAPSRRQIL